MFDRLAGVETEYALRFRPARPGGPRTPNDVLFERLIQRVRARVPIVSAIIRETGWFVANGGAVRLERAPFFAFLPAAGLVEGATPECRGPRQLLLYQRAQDILLSRAAASSGGIEGEAALLKNNRDAHGNLYGSHENYEATIASGPALVCWRVLIALLPLLIPPIIAALVVALLLAGAGALVVLGLRACFPGRFNPSQLAGTALTWLLYLCLLPLLILPQLCITGLAFRRQRRRLLAFLVTRPIFAGTGAVELDGRFTLSPRAAAVRGVCGSAAECSRPVYYLNHIWKGVLGLALGDRWGYAHLFARRQRLQLSVGDSNMAQHAEYLKLGTTLLVLDAIEAGVLDDAPRLWRPLAALRAICADPDLTVKVRVNLGQRRTALQIQRFYLDACRRFVARSGRAHPEAEDVLRLWEETLDALEHDPQQLIGKVDWVTKRHLLDTAGAGASVAARRKLDLRYHELSRDGYYVQLEAAGVAPTLVEPEAVLAAIETPPDGTPADARGRLIRAFVGRPQEVRAGWNAVVIQSGTRSRVVRLPHQGPLPKPD